MVIFWIKIPFPHVLLKIKCDPHDNKFPILLYGHDLLHNKFAGVILKLPLKFTNKTENSQTIYRNIINDKDDKSLLLFTKGNYSWLYCIFHNMCYLP